jgi:hypothetical protein
MSTLSDSLRNALSELFLPVVLAARSDAARRALLRSIGHTDSVADDPDLLRAITHVVGLVDTVADVDAAAMQSWRGISQLLDAGSQASAATRTLQRAARGGALGARLANLGEELLEQLLARYLHDHQPVLYRLAAVLTLVVPADLATPEPLILDRSEMTRLPWRRARLRFDRLVPLLREPWLTLRETYLPHALGAAVDAHTSAAVLFPNLGAVANALDLSWRIDVIPVRAEPAVPPNPDDDSDDHLDETAEVLDPGVEPVPMPSADLTGFYERLVPRFLFGVPPISSDQASTTVRVIVSSHQHPDGPAGIIVTPLGNFNVSYERGEWRTTLAASGEVPAFVAAPDGFALAPSSNPVTAGSARLSIERISQGASPAFVLGSATGTRLEIGAFRVGADFTYAVQRSALSLTLEAESCSLVIVPGDGDGFLREVLPSQGLRTAFEFGLMLSSDAGFSFTGSAGLEAVIPVGLAAGTAARIASVFIGIRGAGDAVRGELSAAASIRLGPMTAVVDRVGIETELSLPQNGGNLGPARVAVGFKPPNGVGLSIETTGITGGGYLFFDPAKQEYAGVLQLELAETIAVTAIGLLTTRMPDGSKGFSLLISISAQGFQPIQLGLGFRLSGIGGLVGVNRTVAVDVLRAGLKKGALDAVLFPADPVRNAAQIVTQIRTVFPPAEGRFIFGPMVVIDWGTPPVVTLDLAVILEVPSPVRLIVLGQIRAALPRAGKAVIQLKMDVLGVLEIDKGELAIDAVLYDSRMLTFAVTGDMALRARWLTDPTFILAAGGLNPHFTPPAGFPTLQRLAISLATGDNPRLRLEAYLALTSNTAQIGARLDLRVAAAGFSIEGYLQFDALFQFSPFQFIVEIGAGVTLKWKGRTLVGVQLALTLAGPSPWHAAGTATFKVWIFSKSVSFDKTFGKAERPAALPPADPLPELVAALGDRRSWTGSAPAGSRGLVSVRDAPASRELRVHPVGSLTVRQRVVPLEIEITKFGHTAPARERRFRITAVHLGGQRTATQPVTDYFAPGQFLDLTEAQRLTRPSFEPLPSGLALTGDAVHFGGQAAAGLMATADIEYETVPLAQSGQRAAPVLSVPLSAEGLRVATAVGAAARGAVRRAGTSRYRGQPRDLTPQPPTYVVAHTADLAPAAEVAGTDATGTSYTAAAQALATHLAAHPDQRGRFKIVAPHELARVA